MSQRKLRIIKDTRYSAGQWRVVDETGDAVQISKVLDLEIGKSVAIVPLCANTKEGLIDEILNLLAIQSSELKKLKSQGS
jgi:translation initiation factor IF-2